MSINLQFPIKVISPVPQGQYFQGQGKRKQKALKCDWHLPSTPNLEEVKVKHSPKNPSEKRKRQVRKKLFVDDENLPSFSKGPKKPSAPSKPAEKKEKRTRIVKKPVYDDSSDEDFPLRVVASQSSNTNCTATMLRFPRDVFLHRKLKLIGEI